MKKSILLIILFISICMSAQMSKNVTISGKVLNKITQEPLEYATAILLNTNNNEIITGSTTNEKGEFSFETLSGTYTVKIEYMGFKNYLIEKILLNKNLKLPNIFLEESSEQLDAIKITAEKSTIEYKLDKRVFNVGKDLISKGGSATDILGNVPSVSVDATGAVSLRGNTNVRILINGKPSVLTNNNGLEQIPAENIEKVEVVTNPSAKYDAEGTAGIINIILKKNKRNGFGSSLQLTMGTPANHGLNYNVNYKTEKINLFSNLGYRYLDFEGEGSYYRTNFENNGISSILDETIEMKRNRRRLNLYFGGDYYINDKNTLTLSYYHRYNVSKNEVNYDFNFLDANQNLESVLNSTENYKEPQKANQIELNYEKSFDKKGKKFTINLQYDFWNDDENESIVQQELFPTITSLTTLKSRDIESSKNFLFQSDYKIPVSDKAHLEMGIKGEVRRINSDYKVWNNEVIVDSLDNLLHYDEGIYGAYLQYGNRKRKFQYLLGLRAEHSNTKSTDRKNQYNNNKNYTKLFPTVHITYSINDATNLQLSYSKRIRRPSFWHLNPFGGISDQQNIRIGNPDLNPMYTNSFEFGTLKRWSKFTLNPSIYYQRTTNLFETLIKTNDDNVLISQTVNSGEEDRIGAELVSTYSPYKWWRLSGEINYYSFKQRGLYNIDDNTWFTRLNSRFKFSKLSFQTSFNYRAANQSGQTYSESQYWANLGISHDFLGDSATLTMNVNNVFNSRDNKRFIQGENYTVNQSTIWSGRRVSATLTYRFNRKKSDRDRMPD
ncbi:MAG: TonB-dependent receptor [Flavobacteriaceae bacterium]|nr:TonB-dependent receptor [Flavobacteriaceae bacterium]